MIAHVLAAHVSCQRVEDFLAQPETAKYSNLTLSSAVGEPSIGFKNASLSYATPEELDKDSSLFSLKDLNLDFPEGELSIIAGTVGSGKVDDRLDSSSKSSFNSLHFSLTLPFHGFHRLPSSSRSLGKPPSSPERCLCTNTSAEKEVPSTPSLDFLERSPMLDNSLGWSVLPSGRTSSLARLGTRRDTLPP